MKTKAVVVLVMGILVLSSCGKKEEKAPLAEQRFLEANEPRPAQEAAETAPPRIRSVVLSPETPTVLDDMTAAVELADPSLPGVDLRYQWFINGRELDDALLETLDKGRLRKGDWVYCRVQASSGNESGEWTKSDLVRVLNTRPLLHLEPVGPVLVPGLFQYRAAASDVDGDDLAFEVVSPAGQGIAIDAKSGLLTWELSGEAVKALGEKAEIRIAVSDGEDRAEGTITLTFASTSRKTEQP